MFRFKEIFLTRLTVLLSLVSTTPLSCISMNNQTCKVRPEVININSNEPALYDFNIKTSKCSGICNNINDPNAKMCIPDVVNSCKGFTVSLILVD